MTKHAVEHLFTGDTVSYTAYDPDKTVLGQAINQTSEGVGPASIIVARPIEEYGAFATGLPSVVEIDDDTNYVFTVDLATATTSRRIAWYVHDKVNATFSYKGFMTLGTLTTNHTVRAFKAIRDIHNTGTVEVTNDGTDSAVTVSGYSWDRISSGSRIGFGTTDPKQVTTWYEFGVNVENIFGVALSYPAGTSYVLEEYRFLLATTANTATNGGLFLMKGMLLRYFNFAGTFTFNLATSSIDNSIAPFWLADASTVTNTTAMGIALEPPIDENTQYAYVMNRTGPVIFKYNIRAALSSIVAGKTTSAFVLKTGSIGALSLTYPTSNACCYADTLNNDSIPRIYAVAAGGCYGIDISGVTNGATTPPFIKWESIADLTGFPPQDQGGSTYITLSSAGISYNASFDKFCFATPDRVLVSRFNQNNIDAFPLVDTAAGFRTGQLDITLSEGYGRTPHLNLFTNECYAEICGGYLYLSRNGSVAGQNFLYVFPISSDASVSNDKTYGVHDMDSWTPTLDFVTGANTATWDVDYTTTIK